MMGDWAEAILRNPSNTAAYWGEGTVGCEKGEWSKAVTEIRKEGIA